MEYDQVSTVFYAICLIILFFCILSLRMAFKNAGYIKYCRYFIRAIGVLPGFLGVLYGVYLQFILNDPSGLIIMSGSLLLEVASVQLLYVLNKHNQNLDAGSDQ